MELVPCKRISESCQNRISDGDRPDILQPFSDEQRSQDHV